MTIKQTIDHIARTRSAMERKLDRLAAVPPPANAAVAGLAPGSDVEALVAAAVADTMAATVANMTVLSAPDGEEHAPAVPGRTIDVTDYTKMGSPEGKDAKPDTNAKQADDNAA